MAEFDIDINEPNGRAGIFDFENGQKIKTPNHVPSRADFNYLQQSQFLKPQDYRNIEVGEFVCWLDSDQILSLINDHHYYQQTKYRISSELREMNIKTKLLHFNFFSDVTAIDRNLLEILLELQNDVGADIIEIPNMYSQVDYRRIINAATAWKSGRSIDKPLMGIACNTTDVDLILPLLDSVDAVGLNLRRYSKPLLYRARNALKNQNKLIYAISAPRHYNSVDKQGTLGVLINWFGVDLVSNPVMNWKGSGAFMGQMAEKSDDELYQMASSSRYFSPPDYSTHTFGYMQAQFGDDYRLSTACNCPVCQNNTVQSILDNYVDANANSRAHQVISYHNEAKNYQKALHENDSEGYINSKPFIKRIID